MNTWGLTPTTCLKGGRRKKETTRQNERLCGGINGIKQKLCRNYAHFAKINTQKHQSSIFLREITNILCLFRMKQKIRDITHKSRQNHAVITRALRSDYAQVAHITQKLRRNYAEITNVTQKIRKKDGENA